MKENILTIHDLHKSFGGLKAIDACTLNVKRGSITGLIGPNGAGKTTVFNLITGLAKPDSGTVHFEDKNITKWPTYKRARRGLTRTFQMIRIFPDLTALDNILVALKSNSTQEAMKLLATVGLEDKANHFAGQLSYGQQKLLEILRAAAINPTLLLLDEPAAGINRTALKVITELILRFQKQGKTILIIEHDMNFIMQLCEKVIVMDFGRVIAEGTSSEIQKNPKVLEAYLGKNAHD